MECKVALTAAFFRQTAAFEGSNENGGQFRPTDTTGAHGNSSSQTLPSGMTGGSSDPGSTGGVAPNNVLEPEEDPFRASLVSKMDALIKDFREDKTSHMETLYQILQILHKANITESVRKSTLEQYTLYVDIITSKHKEAEQRGRHAARDFDQERSGGGNPDTTGLPGNTKSGNANTSGEAE